MVPRCLQDRRGHQFWSIFIGFRVRFAILFEAVFASNHIIFLHVFFIPFLTFSDISAPNFIYLSHPFCIVFPRLHDLPCYSFQPSFWGGISMQSPPLRAGKPPPTPSGVAQSSPRPHFFDPSLPFPSLCTFLVTFLSTQFRHYFVACLFHSISHF